MARLSKRRLPKEGITRTAPRHSTVESPPLCLPMPGVLSGPPPLERMIEQGTHIVSPGSFRLVGSRGPAGLGVESSAVTNSRMTGQAPSGTGNPLFASVWSASQEVPARILSAVKSGENRSAEEYRQLYREEARLDEHSLEQLLTDAFGHAVCLSASSEGTAQIGCHGMIRPLTGSTLPSVPAGYSTAIGSNGCLAGQSNPASRTGFMQTDWSGMVSSNLTISPGLGHGEGKRCPNILFCSYHSYWDPASGAALCTRELLSGSAKGF
jgi:hypothetical protein